MGTNFYRIVTEEEISEKKLKLINEITKLDFSPSNIERGFVSYKDGYIDYQSPWDAFKDGLSIHLGKRSAGWKFCWNFHNNKYYSNKKELLKFIRSGRVIDEYAQTYGIEEFIDMALTWGEPNGLIVNHEYRKGLIEKGMSSSSFLNDKKYDDLIIDGLRVSSSTEFC